LLLTLFKGNESEDYAVMNEMGGLEQWIGNYFEGSLELLSQNSTSGTQEKERKLSIYRPEQALRAPGV
jgi:hypothetical protein